MTLKKYFEQNKLKWIAAFILIIIIKIFSANEFRVEKIYTSTFYPGFSKILRFLFGWIPFSIGDILYFITALWLIIKIIQYTTLFFKRKLFRKTIIFKFFNLILIFCFIYIIFNIFWGINYNRKGVAYQLNLTEADYDSTDLLQLQNLLLQKVNESKTAVLKKGYSIPSNKELFERAQQCYKEASEVYPFLTYTYRSVKSSLYGRAGNYLGFTGYYNPFTGEAQVNTSVPSFLRPYICTHEMAHQLGYAKENEANFAGYLAAVNSRDTLFHYSAYFDLYIYANREVFYFDSTASKNSLLQLNPAIKEDIIELRKFNRSHTSFAEPLITWMYGNYLKMNQQPQGMRSYNEVVGMLIAYYKKYGKI